MIKPSRLWLLLGSTALVLTLLLAGGFVYAVKDMLYTVHTVSLPGGAAHAEPGGVLAGAEQIKITAIGDSLTKGVGDNTGEGYVKQVLNGLKEATSQPVQQINNLAVNGLTAASLDSMLKSDKGLAYPIEEANLILLTIGGNDLFRPALDQMMNGGSEGISVEEVTDRIPAALNSFKSIVAQIRKLNPDATIVYTELYNPFSDIPELRSAAVPVQAWNDYVFNVMKDDPHAVLVPTMDLFQQHTSVYLSSDHFHPNHEGYERIAKRIVQALT